MRINITGIQVPAKTAVEWNAQSRTHRAELTEQISTGVSVLILNGSEHMHLFLWLVLSLLTRFIGLAFSGRCANTSAQGQLWF